MLNDKEKDRQMICIVCPEGCKLHVSFKKEGLEVSGHLCKRGIKFAKDEVLHPTRILTTTVSIESEEMSRLPVRSSTGAPKDMILAMISAVRKKKIKAPVQMGDVIASNILGTGIDIIASASVKK
jgi:CxxC motif-containing protein